MNGFFEKIKEAFAAFVAFLDSINYGIGDAMDKIGKGLKPVGEWFTNTYSSTMSVMSTIVEWLAKVFKPLNSVVSWFNDWDWEGLRVGTRKTVNIFGWIFNASSTVFEFFAKAAGVILKGVEFLVNLFNSLTSFLA